MEPTALRIFATLAAAFLLAASGARALAAPPPGAYGWPLKPFDAPHPVRGYFGDPRINGYDVANATLHFGIDISGADGTPVYATIDGTVSIHPLHHDTVVVTGRGGVAHEYWHVVPAVRNGSRAFAGRTLVGRIEAPWRHVHFSERRGRTYVNPLRPGGLWPSVDTTRPSVGPITLERDGCPMGTRARGTVDLVVEAADTAPIPVAPPWNDKPVTPALVEWRLVGPRAPAPAAWRIAIDFRSALPSADYHDIYARWTRQNHPWVRGGTGRYRFFLTQSLDTRTLVPGRYRVDVQVVDERGNRATTSRAFTIER